MDTTFVDNKMLEIWKTFMSFNPASSLLGIYPVAIIKDVHKDLCVSILHSVDDLKTIERSINMGQVV